MKLIYNFNKPFTSLGIYVGFFFLFDQNTWEYEVKNNLNRW